jgi:hypothetical protein
VYITLILLMYHAHFRSTHNSTHKTFAEASAGLRALSRMDRAALLELLTEADRHLAETDQPITLQREIIAKLKQAGLVRASARDNPSGRGVAAAGYTSLVRWLASPEAEFIQGQIIFVNGGANLSG